MKKFLLYGSFLWLPVFVWYTIIPAALTTYYAWPDGNGAVPLVVWLFLLVGVIATIAVGAINILRR